MKAVIKLKSLRAIDDGSGVSEPFLFPVFFKIDAETIAAHFDGFVSEVEMAGGDVATGLTTWYQAAQAAGFSGDSWLHAPGGRHGNLPRMDSEGDGGVRDAAIATRLGRWQTTLKYDGVVVTPYTAGIGAVFALLEEDTAPSDETIAQAYSEDFVGTVRARIGSQVRQSLVEANRDLLADAAVNAQLVAAIQGSVLDVFEPLEIPAFLEALIPQQAPEPLDTRAYEQETLAELKDALPNMSFPVNFDDPVGAGMVFFTAADLAREPWQRFYRRWNESTGSEDGDYRLDGEVRTPLRVKAGLTGFSGRGGSPISHTLYAASADGRLIQLWNDGAWHHDYPAELAGHSGLAPAAAPAVMVQNAQRSRKALYFVGADGSLAQLWDTNQWHLDHPAALAGDDDATFKGGCAVIPREDYPGKKEIFALTERGKLAHLWDDTGWHVDDPAQLAGFAQLRFKGRPFVIATPGARTQKVIFAYTHDGRLTQIWDTNRWRLKFPAEQAGLTGVEFQGSPVALPISTQGFMYRVYAITKEGRLAQIWNDEQAHSDFPAELAGAVLFRFKGSPAVYGRQQGRKSIFAITTTGRLMQLWDTDRWHYDFPAELAGFASLRFKPGVLVFPRSTDPAGRFKDIFAVTEDDRVAQISDTDRWTLTFPGESEF